MNEESPHVFVMMSFLLRKDDSKFFEEGNTILFESMEKVHDYIQWIKEGNDDRPFESRWNHFVVEKVFFGPYGMNKVMGWWKAVPKKIDRGLVTHYDVVELDECPIPNSENVCNFTISS